MLKDLLREARIRKASDIHISAGMPVYLRIHGHLEKLDDSFNGEHLMEELCTKRVKEVLSQGKDADFALSDEGLRYRVNVYQAQTMPSASIRLLNDEIRQLDELGLPKVLGQLAEKKRGLVIVTGPTGSGKSTTLASMVDHVNERRKEHIITIEDPIEYVFRPKMALIHQREVGQDTSHFASALRSALREDPDVILVGEMRDYETIATALTAAETGHLVLSTLHTTGAAQTIDRIIDACPSEIQDQIRVQLANVLEGVVTQCLIPNAQGNGRVVATEILIGTSAVRNLIRENKGHQIGSMMQSGSSVGMHTLNMDLNRLVLAGKITPKEAYQYTNDEKDLEQFF